MVSVNTVTPSGYTSDSKVNCDTSGKHFEETRAAETDEVVSGLTDN